MVRIQCLTIDAIDPHKLASFWAAVLSWEITYNEPNEVCIELLDGSPLQGNIPDILFIRTTDPRQVKNRMHMDLRPSDQAAEVARIEDLGGRQIDIGQNSDPATTWIVMADSEGNEFCVLKA